MVGFVRDMSLIDSTTYVAAFRQGLQKTGYVEGQKIAIQYRYGENDRKRLPALVADLIRRPVDVIAANVIAPLAAKATTTTVPIVFVTGGDPIQAGLVTSINRPGAT